MYYLIKLMRTLALIKAAGGEGIGVNTDVSEITSVQHMVEVVSAAWGPVDLLVNNAAIAGQRGPIWECDPDFWWRVIEVNVRGPFLCSRAVLPAMIAAGRGRIVNLGSIVATRPSPYSSYGLSKAAIMRFSENLSAETKEFGIQVFTVDPGMVRTAMTERLANTDDGQKYAPWVKKAFEAGTYGTADHTARMVALLASGIGDSLSGRLIDATADLDYLLNRLEEIQQDDLFTLRMRSVN